MKKVILLAYRFISKPNEDRALGTKPPGTKIKKPKRRKTLTWHF